MRRPTSKYEPLPCDTASQQEWARKVRFERGQRHVTRYELLDVLYALAVDPTVGARALLETLRRDWGLE